MSATTRPDSKSTFAAGVNVVRTGYSLGELTAAFRGQDVVICTISTASLGDQMTIAQAAVAAKVKRFIPAEVGMDTSDDKGELTLMPTIEDINKISHEGSAVLVPEARRYQLSEED